MQVLRDGRRGEGGQGRCSSESELGLQLLPPTAAISREKQGWGTNFTVFFRGWFPYYREGIDSV